MKSWPKEPNVFISKGKVSEDEREGKGMEGDRPQRVPMNRSSAQFELPQTCIFAHTHCLRVETCFCCRSLQILKRLNRTHEASLQFSWALDFSRSGCPNNQLREEIDHAYHNQNDSDIRGDSGDADFLIPEEDEEDSFVGVAPGEGGLAGGEDVGSDASMNSF